MAEPSNELLLQVLRTVQTDLSEIRKDIADIKSDMSNVDQKVDGLAVMFALLAGHVHHIEERVEAMEKNR